MKPFQNTSTDGNEKALRRGVRVPDGDINLAWTKGPALSPKNNVVVLDTSNMTPENSGERFKKCRLFAANQFGILEDVETGDSVIHEEYPQVADTFSVDEDWSVVPGREYDDDSILPYLHISRYFHIDTVGLTTNEVIKTVDGLISTIKIVDGKGREYVDEAGRRRYRIALAEPKNVTRNTQTAYRIYAYVDTDNNEDLFLKYNKVELNSIGVLINQDINHLEILNPQPYYKYVPEETDVLDPVNRQERIYSTQPVKLKDQIIGHTRGGKDGYQVFVPKKAIPDPRIFQLFRWRISADFVENVKVDTTRSAEVVRCGVIVTDNMIDDCAPYMFYNMELSDYNAGGLRFVNPLKEDLSGSPLDTEEKNYADYWRVNFDTMTYEDLKQFDILFWHPGPRTSFDLTPYLAKIRYFTQTLKGTIVFETGTHVNVSGLGIVATAHVNAVDGSQIGPGTLGTVARGINLFVPEDAKTHALFDGDNALGGWDFNDGNDDEYNSIHPAKLGEMYYWRIGDGQMNYISTLPNDRWTTLVSITDDDEVEHPKVVIREYSGGGNIIFSTHIYGSVSALEHHLTGQRVSWNRGETAYDDEDYQSYVSSWSCEGSFKLFYNTCLLAVKDRILDAGEESKFTTTWTYNSKWYSSWVVDADVLTQDEKSDADFIEHPINLSTPEVVWARILNGEKTVKQILEDQLSAEELRKVQGMRRSYRIEVTNPLVETISETDLTLAEGNLRPLAWTTAYSPPFTVPLELGPHIIDAEPVPASYDAAQFVHRSYPPKPYGLRVDTSYARSYQLLEEQQVDWTVTGTATEVYAATGPRVYNWAANGGNLWYTHPSDGLIGAAGRGLSDPRGIDHTSYANYYEWALPIYGNFGIHKKLQVGSYGEETTFVQQALNYFSDEGWVTLPYGKLDLDGVFGPKLLASVAAFQEEMGCLTTDGTIDAEGWSAIGKQILRLDQSWTGWYGTPVPASRPGFGSWHRWFAEVRKKMSRSHISDGTNNRVFMMQSPVEGSPPYVWDVFQVSLEDVNRIIGVDIIPYTEGVTDTVRIEAVDVHDRTTEGDSRTSYQGGMLHNYAASRMRIPVRRKIRDGQVLHIPLGPWWGDTVTVALGQDGPSGWGDSRILGVRDIRIHVIDNYLGSRTVSISASGTSLVRTGTDTIVNLDPVYDRFSSYSGLADITWSTITLDEDSQDDMIGRITDDGKLLLRNLEVENVSYEDNFSHGPVLADQATVIDTTGFDYSYISPWRSMNEFGYLNPGPENGWISKTDGIKVFCDDDKNPVGFPRMANYIGLNESQRHYAILSVTKLNCDPSVTVGFWDRVNREFILDESGRPEMPYIEYMARGPQNVYVAAVSNYEERTLADFNAEGATTLPFKWAKPVYGLCFKSGSQIGIEKLPDNLGPTDLWPVPIRTGSFSRTVSLQGSLDQPLTGWLGDYSGTTVRAFYGLPEAEAGGWSPIYGRPYSDVVDETPKLITDNEIQVLQPPFLMVKTPTQNPGVSDPMVPVIKIYTRESVVSPWVEMGWDEIKDYNASNGVVQFNSALESSDPNLVKVSYTTAREVYNFKYYDGEKLNLNPYPGHQRDLIGKAIQIYIVPEYVQDADGNIITDSVETKTLRFGLTPSIFDPINPDYNPLAVRLGVVYVTTALDIKDLTILDTRVRGGGARSSAKLEELKRIVQESMFYWDINPGTGMTYQKGGFVIVRLPSALSEQFPTKEEITQVIERNITLGVQYKLEDSDGNEWV